MGFELTIGEAKLQEIEWDDYGAGDTINAYVTARAEAHDNAPVFPNDCLSSNTNQRSPSYTTWSDFCDRVGLYKMFYGKEKKDGYRSYDGLLAYHPGAAIIGKEHALEVRKALEVYRRENPKSQPGFIPCDFTNDPEPIPENCDHHLARLIWLDYWFNWAVENCDHPILENS